MAAGVTDRLWEVSDIIRLLEEREVRVLAEEKAERERREFSPVAVPIRRVEWCRGTGLRRPAR